MLDLTFPGCSWLGLAVFRFACPKTMTTLQLPLLSSVVSWGGGGYLRPSLSLDSGWVRAYGNFLLTGMQNAVVGLGVAGVGTASSL